MHFVSGLDTPTMIKLDQWPCNLPRILNALDLVGKALTELQPSLPHLLVADRDAARGDNLIHMA
jgi:hypothetical protein